MKSFFSPRSSIKQPRLEKVFAEGYDPQSGGLAPSRRISPDPLHRRDPVPVAAGVAHSGNRRCPLTKTQQVKKIIDQIYEKSHKNLSGLHRGANGREPKSCLGRVFNFKSGRSIKCIQFLVCTNAAESRLENSAQVLSC